MRENSMVIRKTVLTVAVPLSCLRAMLMFGVVTGVLGGLSIDAFAAPTFFPSRMHSRRVAAIPTGGITHTNIGTDANRPLLDTPATAWDIRPAGMESSPYGFAAIFRRASDFRGDRANVNTDAATDANGNPGFNAAGDWAGEYKAIRFNRSNRNSDLGFGAEFNDGINRSINIIPPPGQPAVAVVPAPGAIFLGSIGTCLVGWLRRRKSL